MPTLRTAAADLFNKGKYMCLQTLTNSHYPQPNYTQEFSPKILTLSFSKLSTDVIYFVLLLLFCVVFTMVCKQAIYRGAKSLPHLLPIIHQQLHYVVGTQQCSPTIAMLFKHVLLSNAKNFRSFNFRCILFILLFTHAMVGPSICQQSPT